MLAADLFGTQLRRLKKVKDAPVVGTSVAEKTYAPSFGSYPMYALVHTTETYGDKDPANHLVAMRRDRATSPWLKMATVDVPATSMPDPAASGESTLTPQDIAAVTKAVTALTSQVNTGRGGPALPNDLVTYLAEQRETASYLRKASLTASLWKPSAKDQLAPDGSVQAARTSKGSVVLVEFLLNGEYLTKPGAWVEFTDKDFAAVTGQAGRQTVIRYRAALTVAMTLDAKGKPTVVGHDIDRLV